MRAIGLVILCCSLTGCIIEPSSRAQRVLVAYPEMVTKCALLGEVDGISKNTVTPHGEQLSRYRALDKAAAIGATHIVWVNGNNEIKQYITRGRAYYCDPDTVMPSSYKYIDQYLRIHRYPYDEDGYE